MKLQHEHGLTPEARQAALGIHVAVHDGARMIATGIVILGLCVIVAAFIRREGD